MGRAEGPDLEKQGAKDKDSWTAHGEVGALDPHLPSPSCWNTETCLDKISFSFFNIQNSSFTKSSPGKKQEEAGSPPRFWV